MGQAASKALGRRITAAVSSTTTPKDSIGGGGVVKDPISGFTRGSGHASGATARQDEAQRQFLQSQQQQQQSTNQSFPSSSSAYANATATTTSQYTDKLPDDLIKFMTDVGPLKTPAEMLAAGTTGAKRSRILPNTTTARMSDSLFAAVPPNTSSSEADSSPKIPGVAIVDESKKSKDTSAFYDKTRRTESMRLAENIAGIETTRTTSFSHRTDTIDDLNTGMDVVQLYDLLTTATTSRPTTTNAATSNGLTAADNDPEHLMLLEQTKQFLQVPVLLQDSDDSYVGAWPDQVPTLLQVHRGMQVVEEDDKAKLVLKDLWELDQTSVLSSTTIDK